MQLKRSGIAKLGGPRRRIYEEKGLVKGKKYDPANLGHPEETNYRNEWEKKSNSHVSGNLGIKDGVSP